MGRTEGRSGIWTSQSYFWGWDILLGFLFLFFRERVKRKDSGGFCVV